MADPRLSEFNNLKINFTSILDAGIYKRINFKNEKKILFLSQFMKHMATGCYISSIPILRLYNNKKFDIFFKI